MSFSVAGTSGKCKTCCRARVQRARRRLAGEVACYPTANRTLAASASAAVTPRVPFSTRTCRTRCRTLSCTTTCRRRATTAAKRRRSRYEIPRRHANHRCYHAGDDHCSRTISTISTTATPGRYCASRTSRRGRSWAAIGRREPSWQSRKGSPCRSLPSRPLDSIDPPARAARCCETKATSYETATCCWRRRTP